MCLKNLKKNQNLPSRGCRGEGDILNGVEGDEDWNGWMDAVESYLIISLGKKSYGMVLYGMVWYGMVRYGIVWVG